MSEQPSSTKAPDLSGLPRGAISIRGLPLGRNTRLPSIRSPRDLTLGAQPKRVFTPNIPVRREKKSVESEPEKPKASSNNIKELKQKPPFTSKWQKKERTIIQTEGSIFGEGIAAASPSKHERQRDAPPKLTSKKTIVKKEIDMSDMNSDLNDILRDDFIDDDDDYDEDDDVKPIIYPCSSDAEKVKKEDTPKKSFENKEFAKELGFDVKKIAQFIKKEKCAEVAIKQNDISMDLDSDNEICKLIKQDKPQLFVLQFPKLFAVEQLEDQRDSATEQKKNKAKTGISVLPEGQIGKLQVLKSGRTRLLIGENSYYLDFSNPLRSKNEAVSIQLNGTEKDLTVLGDITHKATVVPDVDKLLESVR